MQNPKVKSVYVCQSCGHTTYKWLGKCPSCAQWNTFVEELALKNTSVPGQWLQNSNKQLANKPKTIATIEGGLEIRWQTGDKELDRVLGGGLVPGSVILIGGEPGIGKSTLLLQLALRFDTLRVLYISGEESELQIKMRADRILQAGKKELPTTCYIFSETSTQNIFKQIELLEPDLVIVDSIQTMHSAFVESSAGSVSQIRECAAEFIKFAKQTGVPVILIGHITKEGLLAGPKVLEHMVDTVMQFEGDRHLTYRVLRTTKNRFGSAADIGIYEMFGNGLREVSNPAEVLLTQRENELSGIAIGSMMEGTRPLIIEVQSLVSAATYGTAQRSTTGYDVRRLHMLLAVLEKRGGFRLGQQDVFLNIAGGIKVEDPAIDLAICASLVSSYEDVCIPDEWCFIAEIGLGGEVRSVNRLENRIMEAQKLGFKKVFVSKFGLKSIPSTDIKIQIVPCAKLDDVFAEIFG